jgi:hypothetical protein
LSNRHESGDVAWCSAFSVEKCLSSTSGVENSDFADWARICVALELWRCFLSTSGVENLRLPVVCPSPPSSGDVALVSQRDFSSVSSVEKWVVIGLPPTSLLGRSRQS